MELTAPHFIDPDAARAYFERVRWPDGPRCPHCRSRNSTRCRGTRHRAGLIKCRDCLGSYTVTVGTNLHRTRVPLSSWLAAIHLLLEHPRQLGVLELAATIGANYRTTRAICMRIRAAQESSASSDLAHIVAHLIRHDSDPDADLALCASRAGLQTQRRRRARTLGAR
jgi:transposase-like protein